MEGEPLTTAPTPTRTGPGRNFEEDPRKALYRVTEAMTMLSLSRTVIYEPVSYTHLTLPTIYSV